MTPALVLVVDDDRDILDTVDLVLKMEGYQTLGARSGGEAIRLLQKIARGELHRPDLMLLDLMLPDMRGEDVLREVRGLLGDSLPVAVMSAAVDAVARSEAMGIHCLPKPFEIADLTGLAGRLVNARRAA